MATDPLVRRRAATDFPVTELMDEEDLEATDPERSEVHPRRVAWTTGSAGGTGGLPTSAPGRKKTLEGLDNSVSVANGTRIRSNILWLNELRFTLI